MGSKNKPGDFDCYANAHPDEPMFVLLGRDPCAPILVELWAKLRQKTGENIEKVAEAVSCALAMSVWAAKLGKEEKIASAIAGFHDVIGELLLPPASELAPIGERVLQVAQEMLKAQDVNDDGTAMQEAMKMILERERRETLQVAAKNFGMNVLRIGMREELAGRAADLSETINNEFFELNPNAATLSHDEPSAGESIWEHPPLESIEGKRR